jgi:hypothetical protein
VYITPREVAPARPRDPPIATGFPVTTPGTENPVFMEYVSMIHDMISSSVFMSGAGMSFSGPMNGRISDAYRRVIRSSSALEWSRGLTVTPPLAPPNGILAMAHFHVIHIARAFTSSSDTDGW